MTRLKNPVLGFIALIIAIVSLGSKSGLFYQAIMSIVVIYFWYANGMDMAVANFRNLILMLIATIGTFYLIDELIIEGKEISTTGIDWSGEMSPGSIARLKESNELVVVLDFDHWPTNAERYLKIQQLPFTDDGLHYSLRKLNRDESRFPKTIEWANQHLNHLPLGESLRTIEQHIKSRFHYSLNPGGLSTTHPLDQFFTETRIGFCEHYSALVATLITQAGFKSRVISGYSVGQWNPITNRLSYRQSDAHAWVEVSQDNGKTWRLVDPTLWVSEAPPTLGIDTSLFTWALGLSLVVIFVLVTRFSGAHPSNLEKLKSKLEKLERKSRLKSEGLTLVERAKRLCQLNPKKSPAIEISMKLYEAAYFSNVKIEKEDELRKSLRAW